MNETGELHSWYVAAGAINAIDVPAGLSSFRIMIREESY